MKSRSAEKIHLTSYDDLFQPDGEDDKKDVQEIALSELHPFRNHPFQVRDDEEMEKLTASIKENGVLVPALARPRAEGGYELISGHRRHHACELAGLATMPVIVKDVDDDQAIVSMVDSNLQREALLPSERAFAYKMKLDAMKRQGKRTDLTCAQVGHKLPNVKSRDILAEQVGESRNQIQRYIRLTELVPDLLKLVDEKRIAFNAAVELSYLKKDEQASFLEVMKLEEQAPSLSQSKRLKKYSQEQRLTEDVMDAIITEEKGKPEKVILHGDKIKKYFPDSYTPAQMESVILGLLDQWKESQEAIK